MKTVQSLIRHANSNINVERRAQSRVVEMILSQDRRAKCPNSDCHRGYGLMCTTRFQHSLVNCREK